MKVRLVSALALVGALTVASSQRPQAVQSAPSAGGDAAFSRFFQARTPSEVAAATDAIVASGVGFDEALKRLRQGRPYSTDVPRGLVQSSYHTDSGEYFYALDVPEKYDPTRKYQVRVQLHG